MKILFVVHGFPPEQAGGTERTVEALARAMQAEGHDVTVVTGSVDVGEKGRIDEVNLDGLRVLRVHRHDLFFESWFKCHHPGISKRLMRLFEDERPDVVHVHHWLRLTSDIVRLARAAGAVTAVTLHDYFSVLARVVRPVGEDSVTVPDEPDWLPAAERDEVFEFHRQELFAEVTAAHLRFVPSQAHGRALSQLGKGALPDLVALPPPLLDRPAPLPQPRDPKRRRLLTWGSLYPDKGLATVLSAMAMVGRGAELSLEVLGEAHDPEFRRELERLADGLSVRFHGAFTHDDLRHVEADFAVLPSLCHESYGLILDEALCLGLPVLAADLPAYRERAPKDSCVFFPPGEAAALASLLQDEARLTALSAPQPPHLDTPADSAAELLRRYQSVEPGPPATGPADREHALQLCRRSEERLWFMLHKGQLPFPEDTLE